MTCAHSHIDLFLVVLVARIHVEELVALVLEEMEDGVIVVLHHGLFCFEAWLLCQIEKFSRFR